MGTVRKNLPAASETDSGTEAPPTQRFRALVEDALAHLYEVMYLQTHPLAHFLTDEQTTDIRGHTLQRLLIRAIQCLRPGADVPYESLAWRKYRYLYLRYVEAMEPAEVADELGVSLRQTSRYLREGVDALTSILWDRHCQVRDAGAIGPVANPTSALPDVPQDSLAEREAARLSLGGGHDFASVTETVAAVIETFAPLASHRGQRVVAELPEDLGATSVARIALRQALLNLLSLASQIATQVGSQDLLVCCARSLRETVEFEVRVKQPEALGNETSDVCQRGAAPTAAPSLAEIAQDVRWRITGQLIEAQRGSIGARTLPDGSGALRLTLPIARPVTVLVVEDNPDVVQLFQRYLTGTPYRVAASDGSDALLRACREQPEVITLDVIMPTRDGWEVLQLLKAHPDTRGTPVIVCSVVQERDLALLLGATGFIPKPVSRPQLLETLATVVPPRPPYLADPNRSAESPGSA